MRDAIDALDWHLRRHRLGKIERDNIRFDWEALASRRLVLVPNYEPNSLPVYGAIRRCMSTAQFFGDGRDPLPVPDPVEIDFFVEVESAIASVADAKGELVYVNFYTEEAYLAVTPEAAEAVFGETAFDLIARAFARCVAEDVLRMRRHRHGLRIFRDALSHFDSFNPHLPMPESVML